MSDLTTEIVYLQLKPGLDFSSKETRSQWDDILGTLAKQPGAKRVLWGRQVEDQDRALMVIDWDVLESHHAFIESSSYHPFIEKINQHFLAGAPSFFHVKLPSTEIAKADPFKSSLTECFSAFFQPDYASSDFDAQFAAFQEQVAQLTNVNIKGLVGGWSLEKQEHEALGEGVQGKMFVMFVGWESMADHVKFRESEDFARVAPTLGKGTVARNARYVELQEYK